jgi:hypothetical protein
MAMSKRGASPQRAATKVRHGQTPLLPRARRVAPLLALADVARLAGIAADIGAALASWPAPKIDGNAFHSSISTVSQPFLELCDRFRDQRQSNNDQRNPAPAQWRNQFAEKNPAAERNEDIDYTRQRKSDGERNISQHVKPTDEAGDDEKNCPPHQGRSQSVNAGPGPCAARVRHLCCSTLQKKFGHEHARNAKSKLQPGVAETGRSILHFVFLACGQIVATNFES